MPVHFLTSTGVRNPFATYRQLFNRMQRSAIFVGRIGFNRIIYLKPDDFAHYQSYFRPDTYVSGKWRRGGNFCHLHANPTEDGYVNVHIDLASPEAGIPLLLLHALLDWLPWTALMVLRLGKTGGDPTLAEMRKMLGHS